MTDEQTTATHSPGPLEAQLEVNRPLLDGFAIIRAGEERVAHTTSNRDNPDEWTANARLLAAAYNSYDKHCGPRAVECAEADLLGEALAACEALAAAEEYEDLGRVYHDAMPKAAAVIAKAKGTTP